jgi:PAS domain S-box-containing protein
MNKKPKKLTNKKLRFLIIEDSEDDAILLKKELAKAYDFVSERVFSAKALEEALQKDWDAIISDYQMPAFTALNALEILHKSQKDLPFIIVSGTIGEDVAVEAMKAGAHDYLMKESLTRLTPVIEREIKEAKIRQERDKGIKDLLASGKEWQETFDAIGDLVAIIDEDMIIQRANKAMFDYFAGKKVIGEHCFHLFHNTDAPPEQCQACIALKNNESAQFEIVHDQEEKQYFSISVFPFGEQQGKKKQFIHVLRDVTEQKLYEEERRQGEKLQALGQLAGGVAHDLNNNLTAIMGFNSLLEMQITDEPLLKYIETIQTAAKRSAELTSQLLAFARKGKYKNAPIDMHQIINDVVSLLGRSIDKRIRLKLDFQAKPSTTLGDYGQLSNAILNLALNARDAMEKQGGELKFSTKVIARENIKKLQHKFPLEHQSYLEIKISDTGQGMDEKTIKRIFEPFFTTKGKAKGTGLGLSAAYGTILNHEGAITVCSLLDKGTTFCIYLPLHAVHGIITIETSEIQRETGVGNIMVVDDEKYIIDVAINILKALGYTPHPCLGGLPAVELYKKNWKEIDLELLDLIMPDLTGEETFTELKKINPDVKVLISSGYSKTVTINNLIKQGAVGSIPKPYEIQPFSQAIKEALKH